MTNSDWGLAQNFHHDRSRSRSASAKRLCMLRKGEHQVNLEQRMVPSMGEELIFSVNGHWRRMRVFRQHALDMLTISVAATVKSLEAKGVARRQRRLAGVPRCSKMSFGDEDLA
jgi:hypothetical protein